jgi:2,4-dienoyl-CoA reductase (NADPH2)
MNSHHQSCEQGVRPSGRELFQPFDIGTQRLKNRLVALPVFSGYADPDGTVSTMLLQHYERLAATGVSMVVANVAIRPDGVTSHHNLRLDQDKFIPGLERLVQTIHRQKALACLQLNHAGRLAKTDRPLLPFPVDSQNLSFNIEALREFMEFFPLEKRFGLTRHFLRQAKLWRQAMSAADQQAILKSFSRAAGWACAAGFDMIELHGGNGYLLCQFFSAFTNPPDLSKNDSFEKRARFPLAVVKRVKNHLPSDFPLGYRLILREGVPGGIDVEEAIAFAQLLEKEGIAYLSTTAGSFNSFFLAKEQKVMARPAYLQKDVARLRRHTGVPTIIAGRINTPALASRLLRLKTTDLIGLGRPLRVDSQWVAKAKNAQSKVTTCINCNWCLKRVILEEGFNCQRWSRQKKQKTDLEIKLLTRSFKTLIVLNDHQDAVIWQDWLNRHGPLDFPMKGLSGISLLFLYVTADGTSEHQQINNLRQTVEKSWQNLEIESQP